MPEKKITSVLHKTQKPLERKKVERVAAYCRVSTLQDEQEMSFESQCEYYTRLIQSNPEMELVGVYGDRGLSGLYADSRPQLQELLSKCRNGEVDVVLVKSVSRFARNAIDCQRMLNELKTTGTVVIFEKEGMRSDDPNFELILKILAAVAQEESHAMSLNVLMALEKCNERGKPVNRCPYGYHKPEKGKGERHAWLISEDEAIRVRLAFNMAFHGHSDREITIALNQLEKKKQTNVVWKKSRVKLLLSDVSYKGDVLTNKSITMDYLSGKRKKNEGEVRQYYIEDHHEGIVSREIFDQVQKIRKAA